MSLYYNQIRYREQIQEVPSQLVNCLSQKDYVQATHLLTSAINTSDSTLKDVVGLSELRIELKSKKQVCTCICTSS